MIHNFDDKVLENFWNKGISRKISKELHSSLKRKLFYLDAAVDLNDLRVPPANHLEALKGELKGYHSIRVNNQWRIVFLWRNDGPDKVRLLDYH
ncbi:MAG: type II toxin-antitoxin system RelE/ParE family toxin [Planctomycetota bacterium]|jgi:proteic killer suppression protein